MTWPLRIFFSAAFSVAAVAQAATVAGNVRLVDSRDPNVRKKSDYSGVVVWLEGVGVPACLQSPHGANPAKAEAVSCRT